jgi:hypothetical protein
MRPRRKLKTFYIRDSETSNTCRRSWKDSDRRRMRKPRNKLKTDLTRSNSKATFRETRQVSKTKSGEMLTILDMRKESKKISYRFKNSRSI